MVKLVGAISRLTPKKVMVVGDFMLDTYTIGKVKRISPEAPVSVLQVLKEENRPGGAGNAILNLVSLGAQVVALGRVGIDAAGQKLIHALKTEHVDTRGIICQEGFLTPVKNRIIAENQQLVRVDFENNEMIPEVEEQRVVESLHSLIEGVEVVAISDYAKGFLSSSLLTEVIELCRQKGIPVIVDPKGTDFKKYAGATVIKPNLSEAIAASGLSPGANLDRIAAKLLHEVSVDCFFITCSEAGISLFLKDGSHLEFPVRVREVKDVTGAGDTVLAVLALAMANKLSLSEAAQLANVAAGIAIEKFGCARVQLNDLARRLLEEHTDNKVFDEDHLTALQEAVRGKPFTLLVIDAQEEFSSQTFKAIHSLSDDSEGELIVYLRNAEQNDAYVSLLASLHDIDFIILKSYSLGRLCEKIMPRQVYFLEKSELLCMSQEVVSNLS